MQAEWLLKRNCSLSPCQAGKAYGALCAVLLAIGLAFTLHGAWWVLAFALLEIGATVAAMLHYARHAGDSERISLTTECLLIERFEAGHLQEIRLDPCWIRIIAPDRRRSLIELESRGVKVAIGCYVSEQTRRQVARELRRALQTSSFLIR